jgi:hypothetical protein
MGKVTVDISTSLDGFIKIELERMRVVDSPDVTHLKYRVVK